MSSSEYYRQMRQQEARARNEAYSTLSFQEKLKYSFELIRAYWRVFLWAALFAGLVMLLANILFSNMMSVSSIQPWSGFGWSGASGLDLMGVWIRNLLVGFVFQSCMVCTASLMLHVVDKGVPDNPIPVFLAPWERGWTLAVQLAYWLALDFIFLGIAAQAARVPYLGIWIFWLLFFIILTVNCCAMYYLASSYDVDFLESVFEPFKLLKINPLAWLETAGALGLSFLVPAGFYILAGFLPRLLALILISPLIWLSYFCLPFFALIFIGYTFKQTKADLELEESGQIRTLGDDGLL